MPSWIEAFERLSSANGEALQKWHAGARNVEEIRRTADAIARFFREYQKRGAPERSRDVPTDYDWEI